MAERAALADLLAEVGPEATTLCEGWTAKDLAAHLVVRERRPLAAAGMVASPLEGLLHRTQSRFAARPFPELVDLVRTGPPLLSHGQVLERVANAVEFFVHHEDVRRASPGWSRRDLDDATEDVLWAALRRTARMVLRPAPGRVVVRRDGGEELASGSGEEVVVSGHPSELLLFLYGRQDHAVVHLSGPEPAVERLRTAALGL